MATQITIVDLPDAYEQDINLTPVDPGFTAADVTGMSFRSTGREVVVAWNKDNAAKRISINSQPASRTGRLGSIENANVPAGAVRVFQIFPRDGWESGGEITIEFAGFLIEAGVNDKLDFTEGSSGAAVATIPAGSYATGSALATAIETAMNAAASDNTYTVTYAAGTFTIARNVGVDTIDLDWNTGPNAATTIGEDIGFDTSADDTGATSYPGDNTVDPAAMEVAVVRGQLQAAG